MQVLQQEFRAARRTTGLVYDRLPNDREFSLLLHGLWHYQYTQYATDLTPELSNWLYRKTQGIPDILAKLLYNAQKQAILDGREKLDSEVFESAFLRNLGMVSEYISELSAKSVVKRQAKTTPDVSASAVTAHIIREVYTGTTYQGRKELDKLLHIVQPGDTIVFDSVSRMSRNADEGCQLYENLYTQNVTLCFLKEPHINTETYRQTIQRQISTQPETGNAATDSFVSSVIAALNQYTVDLAKEQIRLAFAQAQKEVDDLHQRTREGMLTAKLNGKQIGQERGRKLVVKKAAACKDAIKKYSKDFDGTLSDADCIKLIGIARNTYYKYKRELRETISL